MFYNSFYNPFYNYCILFFKTIALVLKRYCTTPKMTGHNTSLATRTDVQL